MTRTRNNSLKRRGTSPAPPRWHEIMISNRKGGDKPKRCGNHNQGGNRNNFRGYASKQSKEDLMLDPAPDPTKITSVEILDEMD